MLPRRWPTDTTTPSGRRFARVAALLLVLVLLIVAVVVVSSAATTARRPSGLALMATDQNQIDTETQKAGFWSRTWWRCSGSRRRELIGSAPPTCRYKCGRCSPCRAVHVPIQPGWSRPMEYYPEAWRCQCGNKLFMP
ncbi:EPIDERMAL PATTERNING FACTOR-like protein 5 isoform X2 [Nymphaea colorata]|uniref:EPIDERMAL PATTERNING FACTOR-like protein 5 isoform X2 n=1 Tax=Nymphaea colorata TaxID=210225 RepID=UPI00129E6996|nr:EPIDERMAL PATTERNING FACTOR-like protein 5 isoform X2 [Nymphaea colorata]